MLAIYVTPVLTWGRELLRATKTITQGMARKVNTALHPNKWTRRSHAIVFTLCTHGHLIHPTMASDYTALHKSQKNPEATTRFAEGMETSPEKIRTKRRSKKTCNGTRNCVQRNCEPSRLEVRRGSFYPKEGQLLDAPAGNRGGGLQSHCKRRSKTPSMVM